MPFLEISTSVACPMRCSYCPREAVESAYAGPKFLSLATFVHALNHCPPDLTVSFAGFAEPYLNRQTSAMIELAAEQRRDVLVYTTGIGLNDADAETLARAHPRILMLHLPDGDGDMKANVTAEYVGRVRRLSKTVAAFQCITYGPWHPLLEEFKPFAKNYRLNSRAGNVKHLEQVRMRGPLKCRVAPNLDENVLLPDGRVVLCCSDWGLRHVIGNLLSETWDEMHAGGKLNAVRAAMHSGDCLCRTCEFAVPA